MPETPPEATGLVKDLYTAMQLGKALGLIWLCTNHAEFLYVDGLRIAADEIKRLREKYDLKIDPKLIVDQEIGRMLGLGDGPE